MALENQAADTLVRVNVQIGEREYVDGGDTVPFTTTYSEQINGEQLADLIEDGRITVDFDPEQTGTLVTLLLNLLPFVLISETELDGRPYELLSGVFGARVRVALVGYAPLDTTLLLESGRTTLAEARPLLEDARFREELLAAAFATRMILLRRRRLCARLASSSVNGAGFLFA